MSESKMLIICSAISCGMVFFIYQPVFIIKSLNQLGTSIELSVASCANVIFLQLFLIITLAAGFWAIKKIISVIETYLMKQS